MSDKKIKEEDGKSQPPQRKIGKVNAINLLFFVTGNELDLIVSKRNIK